MDLKQRLSTTMICLAAGGALGVGAQLLAQPANGGSSATAAAPANTGVQVAPQTARENMIRLQKSISVDFNESKLEDVIKFMSDNTGTQFEPMWKSSNEEGLDKEMLVTLSVKNLDALTVLDKILDKASGDALQSDEKATWQVAPYGAIQIGPRKALNRFKRVEAYDVSDMLFEVPVYDDVPEIDLQQVLQSSGGRGGGGGGRSPFSGGQGRGGNQQRQQERRQRREELANELKRLITSLAEKDQWEDNGGTGGTITVYQGNIIVDAPDYMHRSLVGYTWWPSSKAGQSNTGKRYVTMSSRLEAAQLINMEPFQENGGAGNNR